MIKFSFHLPVDYDGDVLKTAVSKLKVKPKGEITILKKSLDARDKNNLLYNYTVAFDTDEFDKAIKRGASPYDKEDVSIKSIIKDVNYRGSRPIVVGMGPAGLFAALTLAEMGAKPIIIERGKRSKTDKTTLTFSTRL